MKTKNKIAGSGFTLVEIMVAALLLAGLIGAFYSAFLAANLLTRTEGDIAANLAREKLERLYESVRNDWWPTAGYPLSPGGPPNAIYLDPPPDGKITLNGVTYTRTHEVSEILKFGVPVRGYRKAGVTVEW